MPEQIKENTPGGIGGVFEEPIVPQNFAGIQAPASNLGAGGRRQGAGRKYPCSMRSMAQKARRWKGKFEKLQEKISRESERLRLKIQLSVALMPPDGAARAVLDRDVFEALEVKDGRKKWGASARQIVRMRDAIAEHTLSASREISRKTARRHILGEEGDGSCSAKQSGYAAKGGGVGLFVRYAHDEFQALYREEAHSLERVASVQQASLKIIAVEEGEHDTDILTETQILRSKKAPTVAKAIEEVLEEYLAPILPDLRDEDTWKKARAHCDWTISSDAGGRVTELVRFFT